MITDSQLNGCDKRFLFFIKNDSDIESLVSTLKL